jgi:putative ABC transport system ATP-binding protein
VKILRTENLEKSYGSLKVLHPLKFSLSMGESLAVTGPSGSGKSTLLGLLAGLEEPSAGKVFLEGQELTAMNEEELAALRGRRLGFVFQSYRLLPTLSALENVRVPLDLAGVERSEELALDWLKRVGLESRAGHLPGQLSGGEQQRVALARALAPAPALVLADEPTGNLDSKTGQVVRDLLFGLLKGSKTSLILVTHDASLARKAKRVLKLKDGKVQR